MTHLLLEDEELVIPELADAEFEEFCIQNRDRRIERTADGKVIVMSGTGGTTGSRNHRISGQFANWVDTDGKGEGFDSSTAFRLPNSAIRCPDAAWVSRTRLALLTKYQKDRFLRLCPEFIIELMPPSDRLAEVKLKMAEYVANGCELGWLIDADARRVFVYRPAGVETLDEPVELIGEGPVAGFGLDLRRIWDPGW